MKMPDFDTTDYNRTLASIGVALIALAMLVPWLVLHDPHVLEITRAELASFTPTAANAIRSRQDQVSHAQHVWPYFSTLLLLIGATVLFQAVRRIRKLQAHKDEVVIAEGKKAAASWRNQTPDEVANRARLDEDLGIPRSVGSTDDATETNDAFDGESALSGLVEAATVFANRSETDGADVTPQLRVLGFSAPSEVAVELETRVLNRIERQAPTGKDFYSRITLVSDDFELSVDGLIQDSKDSAPDSMVEVKVVSVVPLIGTLVNSAMAQLLRFREALDSSAAGWLVLVIPDQSGLRPDHDPEFTQELIDMSRTIVESFADSPMLISVVLESQIDELRWPRSLE